MTLTRNNGQLRNKGTHLFSSNIKQIMSYNNRSNQEHSKKHSTSRDQIGACYYQSNSILFNSRSSRHSMGNLGSSSLLLGGGGATEENLNSSGATSIYGSGTTLLGMTSPVKSAIRSKANSLTNTYIRASERSSNSSKLEEYGNGRVITEESEQSVD